MTFIALLNSSILYILPVTTGTFCRASELSPAVHSGFGAAGQLITLVYRGMINDLTLWVKVKGDFSAVWKMETFMKLHLILLMYIQYVTHLFMKKTVFSHFRSYLNIMILFLSSLLISKCFTFILRLSVTAFFNRLNFMVLSRSLKKAVKDSRNRVENSISSDPPSSRHFPQSIIM